jgi:uncharacterized RDD family membrane protein YckC
MGFDPHRRFRARPVDYAIVAAAFVVIAALLAWAFVG